MERERPHRGEPRGPQFVERAPQQGIRSLIPFTKYVLSPKFVSRHCVRDGGTKKNNLEPAPVLTKFIINGEG